MHVRPQATLPWNVERKEKEKKGRKIKLLLVLHHNFAAQHTIFKPWLADRWLVSMTLYTSVQPVYRSAYRLKGAPNEGNITGPSKRNGTTDP